jgi:hypothetical protein
MRPKRWTHAAPRSSRPPHPATLLLVAAMLAACDDRRAATKLDDDPASSEGARTDDDVQRDAATQCARVVHELPGGVAIQGCEHQVEAVRNSDPIDPLWAVDIDAAGTSQSFQPGKRLHACEWHSFIDTAKVMMVTCPDNSHVVSGGCMSQTPMLVSAPWEDNTLGNLPEDSERYQDVGDPNGWVCIYDGPWPSGQIATVLCCE